MNSHFLAVIVSVAIVAAVIERDRIRGLGQYFGFLWARVVSAIPRIRARTLDTISLGLALLSVLLAYADTLQVLEFVSPTLAAKWPMFVTSALVVSRLARVFGDWLDNGKLDGSFGKDIPAPTPPQT